MSTIITGRFVQKHDTAANWAKVDTFIPKQGEFIIYDADETYAYERFKIGDGVTNVNDLPFGYNQPDWLQDDMTATNYIKNRPFNSLDGNTLILENGTLRVNTTDIASQNNNLPITSAAVFEIVGNINALLETI